MREYIEKIKEWSAAHKIVAMARVVQTWGSSPRPAGSLMFIDPEGNISGSVSGGCVEGAVVKKALEVIPTKTDVPLKYGVSDEDAWSVGLSCGGSIQVYLQTVDFSDGIWPELIKSVEANKSAILVTSLDEGESSNTLILEDGQVLGEFLTDEILNEARDAYSKRIHKTFTHGDTHYFIQLFPRKSQLLIIGAAHITVDLITLGNMYDFDTVVIDPRGFFADHTTFNDAPGHLIKAYPSEVLKDFTLDAYTFAAILSHDPKIDDDALQVLLPSETAYIGALGSRKTHEKRIRRLKDKGMSDELIEKIHAPIGLPIHAKSAREIALSVMGQIISEKNKYL
ncbi:XdhC family protein [Fulvivirga sedimenti]|uniref:XdhC family protein n=1 Tax=Fulvivirga sedimenti TaxID=2879465 RepID=A0A9X1HMC4_9BACT|nr:XdhC family protein [Fulvivirga sedimenti]MCA6074511.1 XdhC family protein [Fulvivirga sedimenti]MCA6075688.1 XdhC family protein [Fulvivirga sedimenti]MCA6076816.1 XdhC family protein [Fulvivirga sedimenti]